MTMNQFKDLQQTNVDLAALYSKLQSGDSPQQVAKAIPEPEQTPTFNEEDFQCMELTDTDDPRIIKARNTSAIICEQVRNNINLHKQVYKNMIDVHKMSLSLYKEINDLYKKPTE